MRMCGFVEQSRELHDPAQKQAIAIQSSQTHTCMYPYTHRSSQNNYSRRMRVAWVQLQCIMVMTCCRSKKLEHQRQQEDPALASQHPKTPRSWEKQKQVTKSMRDSENPIPELAPCFRACAACSCSGKRQSGVDFANLSRGDSSTAGQKLLENRSQSKSEVATHTGRG